MKVLKPVFELTEDDLP